MKIEILYQDDDVLVVNKPAGILVHGIFDKHGQKHSEEVLTDWIIQHYPKIKTVGDKPEFRPGIVHRLDRETSGVLIIARTQEAFGFLKDQFQTKNVQKTYQALVWGKVKEEAGKIEKPISIKNGTVKRTVFKGKAPRDAVTNYKVLKRLEKENEAFTLLEVQPETGRTHQIRVHLSSLGHQVYGDKLYGKKGDLFGLGRHFLHAQKLSLKLPNGKQETFTAPTPPELQSLIEKIESSTE